MSMGFAISPFKIEPAVLAYFWESPNPIWKALAQYGGIVIEIDGKWKHLPFTMLTFPG